MRIHRLGASFALLAIPAIAAAAPQQQVCFSDSTPLQTTNWFGSLTIQRFDASLGILESVDFQLEGRISGSVALESLDALPATISTDYRAALALSRPGGSVLVVSVPQQLFTDSLGAFDGTVDYAGSSGVLHSGISVQDLQSFTSSAPADLAEFTGPAGAPGSLGLPVDAMANSVASGSGNLSTRFLTSAQASLQVCYNYDLDCNDNGVGDSSDVASGGSNDHDGDGIPDECQAGYESFCEGDGAAVGGGIDCPCGNNGNPGEGCDNGTGSGVVLSAAGTPSVSADTLNLTATATPNGSPGFFFASSLLESGGTGVTWDMGVRCIDQAVIVQKLDNGGTIPLAGAPPISVALSVAPGDTNYFQYWYRNAMGPCSGSANTSNALEVTWGQ